MPYCPDCKLDIPPEHTGCQHLPGCRYHTCVGGSAFRVALPAPRRKGRRAALCERLAAFGIRGATVAAA